MRKIVIFLCFVRREFSAVDCWILLKCPFFLKIGIVWSWASWFMSVSQFFPGEVTKGNLYPVQKAKRYETPLSAFFYSQHWLAEIPNVVWRIFFWNSRMHFALQRNSHIEQWLQYCFWETIHSFYQDSTNIRFHSFFLCCCMQVWRFRYFVISLGINAYAHGSVTNCSRFNGYVKFIWLIF